MSLNKTHTKAPDRLNIQCIYQIFLLIDLVVEMQTSNKLAKRQMVEENNEKQPAESTHYHS